MFSRGPQGGPRTKRTKYNKNQLKVLIEAFEKEPYPDVTVREELAKRIQIPEPRIQVLFQNRRARKRKNFQRRPCGKAADGLQDPIRADSMPLTTALASRAFS